MLNNNDKENIIILFKIILKHRVKFLLIIIISFIYYIIMIDDKDMKRSSLIEINFSTFGKYRVEIYKHLEFITTPAFPNYNIFIYDNSNNEILYSFYEHPMRYFEIYWGGSKNDTSIEIDYILNIYKLPPERCIGFVNCKELTNFLKRKLINDKNNYKIIK
ncbi:hypothetical protein [Fluviispira vulneris]|uniref:hypothetical protein n=1 Tax=Fluviispira vulneris TaxID=2763012 RepID=UPI001645EFB5|nr:hypothetical protein [Fluviispira vulneris]